MEKQGKNKNTPFIVVTILLVVVTVSFVITLILGIYHNIRQEELIAKLKMNIEEYKDMELKEFISILQVEPDEYLEMFELLNGKKIPTFNNINEAEPEWVWKNVKNFLEYSTKESFTYEDIIKYSKLIYGNNFNLKLPEEGGYGFVYDSKKDQYVITQTIDLGEEDTYITIKNVKENEKQTIVEIVEYTVQEEYNEEDEEILSLYDENNNLVKSYKVESDNGNDDYMEKWKEIEKESKNMKASKKIKLELNEKQIYNLVSISNI